LQRVPATNAANRLVMVFTDCQQIDFPKTRPFDLAPFMITP